MLEFMAFQSLLRRHEENKRERERERVHISPSNGLFIEWLYTSNRRVGLGVEPRVFLVVGLTNQWHWTSNSWEDRRQPEPEHGGGNDGLH